MRLPGLGEILLILLLVAMVFTGSKVNAIGDALGGFVKGWRRGLSEDERIKVRPTERKDS
jgi:Sec-independent protein translocase protein TatA